MERVTGIDMTRGLAVLGMFTAHLGDNTERFWTSTGWQQVTDGRSAATFALLAGVSAALLSGGPAGATGEALRRSRVRVVARAALLWPLGVVLVALGTPVVVILPGYALMFALSAAVLSWSRPALLALAGVVAALGPLLRQLAEAVAGGADPVGRSGVLGLLVGEFYPAVVWMAYLLVGVAVGRLDLTAPATARRLALVGLAAAVVGYGSSAVALRLVDREETLGRALLSAAPHASTTPEVVGNIGVSLLVLAGCLTLGRAVPRLVTPLAATGALALTAYSAQLVAIAAIGDEAVLEPSNARLAVFVLATLVTTTLWWRLIGRGPLERLFHQVSTAAAEAVAPRRPAGAAELGPAVRPGPAADRAGS